MSRPESTREVVSTSGEQKDDTSKEDVLKQIFGNIGELIEDFTCAAESTVLLHGRMYITNKFICFYSNLFGLEKKIRIPYSHIKAILKKHTAKVLPNAIAICTYKKDYTFRSFWDRDDCFRILTAFLDKYKYGKEDGPTYYPLLRTVETSPHQPSPPAANSPLPSPLPLSSVSGARGSTTGASGCADAAAGTAGSAGSAGTAGAFHDTPTSSTASASTESTPPNTPGEQGTVYAWSDSGSDKSVYDKRRSLPLLPSRLTPTNQRPQSEMIKRPFAVGGGDAEELLDFESGESPDNTLEEETAGSADHGQLFTDDLEKTRLKHAVVTETLDISMNDFISVFLEDSAPHNYKSYHESLKDTNVSCEPWGESPLGRQRDLKFFKPVNLPGLKDARGTKIQRLKVFGTYGFLLHSCTKLEDIPASDAFSVDDVMAVRAIGENQVSIEICFQVTFVKSVFFVIKNLIEVNTNTEMKKWLQDFFIHLKTTVELFKNGKVSINGLPPSSTTDPEIEVDINLKIESSPSPKDMSEFDPPVHHPAMQKTVADRGMDILADFKSQSLGDKVKLGLLVVFFFFLIVNYFLWRAAMQHSRALDDRIREMEELLLKLVQQQTTVLARTTSLLSASDGRTMLEAGSCGADPIGYVDSSLQD